MCAPTKPLLGAVPKTFNQFPFFFGRFSVILRTPLYDASHFQRDSAIIPIPLSSLSSFTPPPSRPYQVHFISSILSDKPRRSLEDEDARPDYGLSSPAPIPSAHPPLQTDPSAKSPLTLEVVPSKVIRVQSLRSIPAPSGTAVLTASILSISNFLLSPPGVGVPKRTFHCPLPLHARSF